MLPTLQPGDRLLVRRGGRLAPGDVVAVADPRQPDRVLVKRVASVSGEAIEVRGDNHEASTDSRLLGPVPQAGVWGRVVYRYAPADRRGRLDRLAGPVGGSLEGDVVRRRRAGDGGRLPG